MQGDQLVKKLWLHQLQTWHKQLCANAQNHGAAHQKHRDTKNQVHDAYVFVVGRLQPVANATVMMMRIMSCMRHIVRHIVCHELSFETNLSIKCRTFGGLRSMP